MKVKNEPLLRGDGPLRFGLGLAHLPNLAQAVLLEVATRDGLSVLSSRELLVDDGIAEAESLGEVLYRHNGLDLEVSLVRLRWGPVALLQSLHGAVTVHLAAKDGEALDRAEAEIRAALRPVDPPYEKVGITFWAGGAGGPDWAHREITAPTWSELEDNHAAATGTALAPLMGATEPGTGRLVLWHGMPGTGKTHAVRALVREWREWCIPHFITDPEVFLGGGGKGYVLDVLGRLDPDPKRDREWRLVILEDAGELLAADARARTGQALSRLLNVTDGLLGQGLNAIVLVTTNEPLAKLHPAVQRPGRCWADVEFLPLSAQEASAWLGANGTDAVVTSPAPIAELYALRDGRVVREREAFGFAA